MLAGQLEGTEWEVGGKKDPVEKGAAAFRRMSSKDQGGNEFSAAKLEEVTSAHLFLVMHVLMASYLACGPPFTP